MKCSFTRLLYPKTLEESQNGSYTIALFRPREAVLDGDGQKIASFKAVGYYLPLTEKVTVDMAGHWRKDPKYGLQFEMESYEDVVESGRRDHVYRPVFAEAEQGTAAYIQEMLSKNQLPYMGDLDEELDQQEELLGLTLAEEQRHAVKTALAHPLSIITGGPGTGKTLIQRVLLNIYAKAFPDARIVCCAPTGRAARRMEQSTGFFASTVHKALGLTSGERKEDAEPPEILTADLVLVDEVSMLDMMLTWYLIRALPLNCRLILIGDADQLPSVGPGAVFSELLACGKIPQVRLDRVFRQDEGSRIAENAKLIRHGQTDFYEGLPRRKAYRQLQARLEGQGTYVYHRSEAERPKAAPPPENPEAALADADTRHRVYTALLTRLQLAPDHRENLLGRGLVDDEITRLQYRTAPTSGLADLAAALEGEGCSPLGVPGFYRDRQGQWTLASYRRGILIPCRDRFGRIQSLHVRLDKELKRGGKFLTFSSPDKRDGCGAQNWCHMAGPVQPEILLIEGYMKADIVHYFTGQTVLAIPGVTSIQHLESVLKELIGLGVKHVMTCFDMDYMRNWHVEGAYGKLREMLGGLNLTFGTYVWDPAYNGLDDYIWQFWMNKGELSHESLEKA